MEGARLRIRERKSYDEIAKIPGFKEKSGAHDAVMRHLRSEQISNSEQLRSETVAIFDEVSEILLKGIRKGKTYDVERLVRVLDKRDRYVPGFEAPIQIEFEDKREIKAEAEILIGKFKSKPICLWSRGSSMSDFKVGDVIVCDPDAECFANGKSIAVALDIQPADCP
jgi:hypothetical protein